MAQMPCAASAIRPAVTVEIASAPPVTQWSPSPTASWPKSKRPSTNTIEAETEARTARSEAYQQPVGVFARSASRRGQQRRATRSRPVRMNEDAERRRAPVAQHGRDAGPSQSASAITSRTPPAQSQPSSVRRVPSTAVPATAVKRGGGAQVVAKASAVAQRRGRAAGPRAITQADGVERQQDRETASPAGRATARSRRSRCPSRPRPEAGGIASRIVSSAPAAARERRISARSGSGGGRGCRDGRCTEAGCSRRARGG